jgi:glycoprotein endo-alpha-1,2-mannosidase
MSEDVKQRKPKKKLPPVPTIVYTTQHILYYGVICITILVVMSAMLVRLTQTHSTLDSRRHHTKSNTNQHTTDTDTRGLGPGQLTAALDKPLPDIPFLFDSLAKYQQPTDTDSPSPSPSPSPSQLCTSDSQCSSGSNNISPDLLTPTDPSFLGAHAFFYTWYGNTSIDGEWLHWNHRLLEHWRPEIARSYPTGRFDPPHESGSPYRPMRGLYSSNHVQTLIEQFGELRRAGVNVISASWWGQPQFDESVDGEGVKTDLVFPNLMLAAEQTGMLVTFHLEPYAGRTPARVRNDIEYIFQQYGSSTAFYRDPSRDNRPLFYVYDSYLHPAQEWATMLASVRNTSLDADYISLYLTEHDQSFILESTFDGMYTYFASTSFTFGSNPNNWPSIHTWAEKHKLLFIPCIGAGYDDTWIRPWNAQTKQDRRDGQYYADNFEAVFSLRSTPHIVAITSYNEWGEGTQIEPVVPYTSPAGRAYENYGTGGPHLYMNITRRMVHELVLKHRSEPPVSVRMPATDRSETDE